MQHVKQNEDPPNHVIIVGKELIKDRKGNIICKQARSQRWG